MHRRKKKKINIHTEINKQTYTRITHMYAYCQPDLHGVWLCAAELSPGSAAVQIFSSQTCKLKVDMLYVNHKNK